MQGLIVIHVAFAYFQSFFIDSCKLFLKYKIWEEPQSDYVMQLIHNYDTFFIQNELESNLLYEDVLYLSLFEAQFQRPIQFHFRFCIKLLHPHF